MNPSSYPSTEINFTVPIGSGTYDVSYTLINHDDNDTSTTITTQFECNGNTLDCLSGGLGTLGFWIGEIGMTGDDFPWTGINTLDFNGNYSRGTNVEIQGLTISASGTTYLDNQTIILENGIQPGPMAMVNITTPIAFTQTLVGPGYDDSDLIISLSGTVTIKDSSNSDSVIDSYSFSNEPYRISGGSPIFYYDSPD